LSAEPTPHPHHPALKHHFDDLGQQHEASTLGMWAFLTTEILFFGGLFFAYALYRSTFHDAFIEASKFQNVKLGAINTVVLILSSLTVALSVYFAQTNKRRALIVMIILTMILGSAFLVIKGIEYNEHFEHHLFPGKNFQFHAEHANPRHVEMFFVLYFCMTGLHASHMIIGLGIYLWLLIKSWRGAFSSEYYTPVEVSGLYWHFVDIVWIFLFPLLYLIR